MLGTLLRTLLRTLPRSVGDALAGRDAQPVTTGMSGTRVLRCTAPGAPTLYLKAGTVDTLRACASHSLGDEAARLCWLAAHGVPVPAVHRYERVDDVELLLLAEVPGVDAATLAEWSVAYNLGDAWAPRLLEGYGSRDVDERRLRFYGALDDFF
jgi:aminoglycoside phosphotransferase